VNSVGAARDTSTTIELVPPVPKGVREAREETVGFMAVCADFKL
jgi:hypothetical protein